MRRDNALDEGTFIRRDGLETFSEFGLYGDALHGVRFGDAGRAAGQDETVAILKFLFFWVARHSDAVSNDFK